MSKIIDVPGVGPVTFTKYQRSRSIRIRISGHNILVTLPKWTPYIAAQKFVESRREWIVAKKAPKANYYDGMKLGKTHTLSIKRGGETITSRVNQTHVSVVIPLNDRLDSVRVTDRITAAVVRALKKQATEYLPKRIDWFAQAGDYRVNSLSFKKLKSRWGSCSHNQDITFNVFLMQLPWEIIDYVIVHELAHTKHLNHSQSFWLEVSKLAPNYKRVRKQLKAYQPHIISQ